jgi:hypothetical protein
MTTLYIAESIRRVLNSPPNEESPIEISTEADGPNRLEAVAELLHDGDGVVELRGLDRAALALSAVDGHE